MSPEHISGQCLRRNSFGKVWSAKCSSLLGIQIILLRFETIWLIMNCSAMILAETIFLRKTLHRQLQPNSAGWDNSSTMYFGQKAYMGNISRQLCRSISADKMWPSTLLARPHRRTRRQCFLGRAWLVRADADNVNLVGPIHSWILTEQAL